MPRSFSPFSLGNHDPSAIFTHLQTWLQLDSAIHWKNHYPVDNAISVRTTYPFYSDLSGGYRYPTLEQPGPGGGPVPQKSW